jgi:NitT/TauT family transport system ATP-binding protein
MVVLDRAGQRLVQAAADERKAVFREQLLSLGLFRAIDATLRRAPGHRVDRDFVLETIILRMPQENPEEIFETFISWARFGNLFAYDETTETVSLQEEVEAPSSPA